MGPTKISIRLLIDPAWKNVSDFDFNINRNVDIWRINISSNLALIPALSALLSRDEQTRAGRYLHQHDEDRFKISRGALRIIVGRYLNIRPSLIDFKQGINKKPYIKNSSLFYNVSHSGDWIILAVSGSEVGVDTERVNPQFDFNDVIKEYFSPGECSFINEDDSTNRFFMLWTRKEALTKATGKGLDEDLKFIPCTEGVHLLEDNILLSENNWIVNSFVLSESYFASVAHHDHNGMIRFWETDLQNKGWIGSYELI